MFGRVVILGCAVAYGVYMWQARTTDRALADQMSKAQKNGDALREREKELLGHFVLGPDRGYYVSGD
jgi:hypothetical protein